jgi:hypothetical protein
VSAALAHQWQAHQIIARKINVARRLSRIAPPLSATPHGIRFDGGNPLYEELIIRLSMP